MPRIEVSIIQNDCTSCGECPEIAPRHFFMDKDYIAHVKQDSKTDPNTPEFTGLMGKVLVAQELEGDVIEAAELCPGRCIYVEEVGNEAIAM